MNDLAQCEVLREDFQRWLNLGNAPITLCQGDKATAMLTRLEKSPSVDYLYRTAVEKDGGVSWNNSLLFCGVWDRQHQALYMTKDTLSCVTTGQYPFASVAVSSVKEEISNRVNQCAESIIANDRSNLAVIRITDSMALRDLEYYQEHGAKEAAIRMLFKDEIPDGQFHSGFVLTVMGEADFMDWLHDSEAFTEKAAAQYLETQQEKILLGFLESDALLEAYQTLMEDTGSPIHRMKAITGAIKGSGAKSVTVSIQKDEKELTFKTEASSLTGYKNWYSALDIPAQDRRKFKELFGRHADYCAEDITKITYGKKTIYEAPPIQNEDMVGPEMEGMNFG